MAPASAKVPWSTNSASSACQVWIFCFCCVFCSACFSLIPVGWTPRNPLPGQEEQAPENVKTNGKTGPTQKQGPCSWRWEWLQPWGTSGLIFLVYFSHFEDLWSIKSKYSCKSSFGLFWPLLLATLRENWLYCDTQESDLGFPIPRHFAIFVDGLEIKPG